MLLRLLCTRRVSTGTLRIRARNPGKEACAISRSTRGWDGDLAPPTIAPAWRLDYVTQGQLTRERGSSYLTLLETTGILGTLPFGLLLLALIREIWRVFLWLRHSGKISQPAVVAAAIILGGLVNAFFEDWMFAVGYYFCVIFWVLALSLRDWMACPV